MSLLWLDSGSNSHTFVSCIRMTSTDLSTISPVSQLATRVALLHAAERLFSQNGIEGTSVREIIKRAECARRSRSLAPSPELACEAVAHGWLASNQGLFGRTAQHRHADRCAAAGGVTIRK